MEGPKTHCQTYYSPPLSVLKAPRSFRLTSSWLAALPHITRQYVYVGDDDTNIHKVAEPDQAAHEVYTQMLPRYQQLENRVGIESREN